MTRAANTSANGLFSPLTLRSVTFANRIGVSPMCMYSCEDGLANNWHLVHLGSRAVGGAGLVVAEATAVSPWARISPWDLGLWSDKHVEALRPLAAFISEQGSVPGIQIAHAGRKAGRLPPYQGGQPISGWETLVAPSAVPYQQGWPQPRELDHENLLQVTEEFAAASRRAFDAGFKVLEAHFAHGYLLHQFLSPLSNRRTDEFGGSLENRARFPLMVIRAMRAAWPAHLPLFVRLSVVDWADGGLDLDESLTLASWLKEAGVDLVDCSSGSVVPKEKIPLSPGYHAPFARQIRERTGMATGVVGLIFDPTLASALIQDGSADFIFLARAMLRDPYWPRTAAAVLQATNDIDIPTQYRWALERSL
ncbi:NADH:flavin oxidoreductase/NADH oxidase [Mesorhizobium sp. CO1-1-8]|uniref:NADH:flavin oxidoreductase/NADH oxidase n=1 Tax=Mesorhizobium sp. CO1-1-8 TaxID=2876631 RepID=UPI001CD0B0EE|nr:NADH:flavin oxidoreductase/NADH oxidase [Mesorhizobium sp. CO1-1-8]MBZ9772405.1 NADH:flavin oxidoreductase/NADH oxidase [Mesorhizobium sp. CO1-1-8]